MSANLSMFVLDAVNMSMKRVEYHVKFHFPMLHVGETACAYASLHNLSSASLVNSTQPGAIR